MKNLKTGPRRLGAECSAERRKVERDAMTEIAHKCPECKSDKYFPEAGCHVCRSCGFSPCK